MNSEELQLEIWLRIQHLNVWSDAQTIADTIDRVVGRTPSNYVHD